jgi:cell division septum initiation protein DivIVA
MVTNGVLKVNVMESDEYEKELKSDMMNKLAELSKRVKENIHNFYGANLITIMKENEKLKEEIKRLENEIKIMTSIKMDASSQTIDVVDEALDKKMYGDRLMSHTKKNVAATNWKSLLQEFTMMTFKECPKYLTKDIGDCHAHIFVSEVKIGTYQVKGEVKNTKKESEQSAAHIMHDLLLS